MSLSVAVHRRLFMKWSALKELAKYMCVYMSNILVAFESIY